MLILKAFSHISQNETINKNETDYLCFFFGRPISYKAIPRTKSMKYSTHGVIKIYEILYAWCNSLC